jgi:hypothetical protein
MQISKSSTLSVSALQFSFIEASSAEEADSSDAESSDSPLLEQAVIMDKAITIRAVIRKEENLLRSVKIFISNSLVSSVIKHNHKGADMKDQWDTHFPVDQWLCIPNRIANGLSN